MGSLVLKSGNALNSDVDSLDFITYKSRVLDDGGVIINEASVKEAMSFVFKNNLNTSNVFSATSPAWGVKFNGSSPIKLYSLFSKYGDIEINGEYLTVDQTSQVPFIALRGNVVNSFKSISPVNNINSAAICVVAKPPSLANGAAYGSPTIFSLCELVGMDSATVADDVSKQKYEAIFYRRNQTTDMPSAWRSYATSHNNTGAADTAGVVVGADKWSSAVAYADNSKLKIYESGIYRIEDTSVTPASKSNLYFNIGRSRISATGEPTFMSALYANMAEAWCLVNIGEDAARLLSQRIHDKYSSL